ncbi:hypothetical protein [Azospira sp. I09]|uniref:hypothetical protein n=1 Tax=Azospira sp. I09 TaxID=1765049 RepID=UPI001E5AF52C|nr:hypothetical protein [Azospira sp. I09]
MEAVAQGAPHRHRHPEGVVDEVCRNHGAQGVFTLLLLDEAEMSQALAINYGNQLSPAQGIRFELPGRWPAR